MKELAHHQRGVESISKELYVQEALGYVPKILELMDRNPVSRTYGCFDRAFWHYRTADFPSGMYGELVLPLALVYRYPFPENQFFQQERIRKLVVAGIDFARRSSHRDGSCDDYFPYEKALGAAAFSLYAMTESCLILGLHEEEFFAFFKRRAEWILGCEESGGLSNHHAIAAVAFYNVFLLTRDERFRRGAEQKLSVLLSWQREEGWFPEYGGCDPGYLTFTIDFLAKYFQKTGDDKLLGPLRRAIEFASFFVHPDGTVGGEYGSRNTFHFLPHGFELMGRYLPLAVEVADRFLGGVARKNRALLEDDRVFCHSVYNLLQAYLDFCPARSSDEGAVESDLTRYFSDAKLYVRKEGRFYIVISGAKGGVFKVFEGEQLVASDTGVVAETERGVGVVSQVWGDWTVTRNTDHLEIAGFLHRWKNRRFNAYTFVLFRLFLLSFGRFFPSRVRRLAQKKLILEKKALGIRFRRRFSFGDEWRVEDEWELTDPKIRLRKLFLATDSTAIYVATSQPYQPGVLKEWINLQGLLPEFNQTRRLKHTRSFK